MKTSLIAALAIGVAAIATGASAQDFPQRPITLVNPYSAGGPADLIGRTVAEGMSQVLGQPVVVENRPGAATAIAATHVAQSQPDGYTLLIAGSPTHVVTPAIQPDANYDGIGDFTPVSTVALVPNVLVVSAASGITSVEELVARAEESAGAVSFASVGQGSLPHLSSLLFQQETGTELTHIPYGGAAPAVVDILAGNVDMGFLNAPPMMEYFSGGELIPLGLAASDRASGLPDVPTMEELGYGTFEMSTWYGISAPADTPEEVVEALDNAIAQALEMPEVQERLTKQGVEIFYKPSAEFASYLEADADRMLQLLEVSGVGAPQ
mgnify:CR=1 FL=1